MDDQTSPTTPTEIALAGTLDEDDDTDFSLKSFIKDKAKRIAPRYARLYYPQSSSDSGPLSGYEIDGTGMDDENYYGVSGDVNEETSSFGSNTTPSSEAEDAKLPDIEDFSTKGACTKKKGSLTKTAASSEKTMKGNSHTKETNSTISFTSVAPSQTSSTAFFKIKGNLPTYNNTVDLSTECSVLLATDNSTFVDRAVKMNYSGRYMPYHAGKTTEQYLTNTIFFLVAVFEFMNGWLEANRTTEGGIGFGNFFYRSWGGTNNPMCGNLSSELCTPSGDCDGGKTKEDTTNPVIRKELDLNFRFPRQVSDLS